MATSAGLDRPTSLRSAWLPGMGPAKSSVLDAARKIAMRRDKRELLKQVPFTRQLPAVMQRTMYSLVPAPSSESVSTSSRWKSAGGRKSSQKSPGEASKAEDLPSPECDYVLPPARDAGGKERKKVRLPRPTAGSASAMPGKSILKRPNNRISLSHVVKVPKQQSVNLASPISAKAVSMLISDTAVASAAGARSFGKRLADTLAKNMSSVADPKFPHVLRKSINDYFIRRDSDMLVLDSKPKTLEQFQRGVQEYDLIPAKLARNMGMEPGIYKVKKVFKDSTGQNKKGKKALSATAKKHQDLMAGDSPHLTIPHNGPIPNEQILFRIDDDLLPSPLYPAVTDDEAEKGKMNSAAKAEDGTDVVKAEVQSSSRLSSPAVPNKSKDGSAKSSRTPNRQSVAPTSAVVLEDRAATSGTSVDSHSSQAKPQIDHNRSVRPIRAGSSGDRGRNAGLKKEHHRHHSSDEESTERDDGSMTSSSTVTNSDSGSSWSSSASDLRLGQRQSVLEDDESFTSSEEDGDSDIPNQGSGSDNQMTSIDTQASLDRKPGGAYPKFTGAVKDYTKPRSTKKSKDSKKTSKSTNRKLESAIGKAVRSRISASASKKRHSPKPRSKKQDSSAGDWVTEAVLMQNIQKERFDDEDRTTVGTYNEDSMSSCSFSKSSLSFTTMDDDKRTKSESFLAKQPRKKHSHNDEHQSKRRHSKERSQSRHKRSSKRSHSEERQRRRSKKKESCSPTPMEFLLSPTRVHMPHSYDSLMKVQLRKHRVSAHILTSTSTSEVEDAIYMQQLELEEKKRKELESKRYGKTVTKKTSSTESEPITPPDRRAIMMKKHQKKVLKVRQMAMHNQAKALAQQGAIDLLFDAASKFVKRDESRKKELADAKRPAVRNRSSSIIHAARLLEKPMKLSKNITVVDDEDKKVPIHELVRRSREKAVAMKKLGIEPKQKQKSMDSPHSANYTNFVWEFFGFTPVASGKQQNNSTKGSYYPPRAQYPPTRNVSTTVFKHGTADIQSVCSEGALGSACSEGEYIKSEAIIEGEPSPTTKQAAMSFNPMDMQLGYKAIPMNDRLWQPSDLVVAKMSDLAGYRVPEQQLELSRPLPIAAPGFVFDKVPGFTNDGKRMTYMDVSDHRLATGMAKSIRRSDDDLPLTKKITKKFTRTLSKVCFKGRQWRDEDSMYDKTPFSPSPSQQERGKATTIITSGSAHARRPSLTQRMRSSVGKIFGKSNEEEEHISLTEYRKRLVERQQALLEQRRMSAYPGISTAPTVPHAMMGAPRDISELTESSKQPGFGTSHKVVTIHLNKSPITDRRMEAFKRDPFEVFEPLTPSEDIISTTNFEKGNNLYQYAKFYVEPTKQSSQKSSKQESLKQSLEASARTSKISSPAVKGSRTRLQQEGKGLASAGHSGWSTAGVLKPEEDGPSSTGSDTTSSKSPNNLGQEEGEKSQKSLPWETDVREIGSIPEDEPEVFPPTEPTAKTLPQGITLESFASSKLHSPSEDKGSESTQGDLPMSFSTLATTLPEPHPSGRAGGSVGGFSAMVSTVEEMDEMLAKSIATLDDKPSDLGSAKKSSPSPKASRRAMVPSTKQSTFFSGGPTTATSLTDTTLKLQKSPKTDDAPSPLQELIKQSMVKISPADSSPKRSSGKSGKLKKKRSRSKDHTRLPNVRTLGHMSDMGTPTSDKSSDNKHLTWSDEDITQPGTPTSVTFQTVKGGAKEDRSGILKSSSSIILTYDPASPPGILKSASKRTSQTSLTKLKDEPYEKPPWATSAWFSKRMIRPVETSKAGSSDGHDALRKTPTSPHPRTPSPGKTPKSDLIPKSTKDFFTGLFSRKKAESAPDSTKASAIPTNKTSLTSANLEDKPRKSLSQKKTAKKVNEEVKDKGISSMWSWSPVQPPSPPPPLPPPPPPPKPSESKSETKGKSVKKDLAENKSPFAPEVTSGRKISLDHTVKPRPPPSTSPPAQMAMSKSKDHLGDKLRPLPPSSISSVQASRISPAGSPTGGDKPMPPSKIPSVGGLWKQKVEPAGKKPKPPSTTPSKNVLAAARPLPGKFGPQKPLEAASPLSQAQPTEAKTSPLAVRSLPTKSAKSVIEVHKTKSLDQLLPNAATEGKKKRKSLKPRRSYELTLGEDTLAVLAKVMQNQQIEKAEENKMEKKTASKPASRRSSSAAPKKISNPEIQSNVDTPSSFASVSHAPQSPIMPNPKSDSKEQKTPAKPEPSKQLPKMVPFPPMPEPPKQPASAATIKEILKREMEKSPGQEFSSYADSILQSMGYPKRRTPSKAYATEPANSGLLGAAAASDPTIFTQVVERSLSKQRRKKAARKSTRSLDAFNVEPGTVALTNRQKSRQRLTDRLQAAMATAGKDSKGPPSRESRKWRHSQLQLTNEQWNPMTPINQLPRTSEGQDKSKKKAPSILKQMAEVEKRLAAQNNPSQRRFIEADLQRRSSGPIWRRIDSEVSEPPKKKATRKRSASNNPSSSTVAQAFGRKEPSAGQYMNEKALQHAVQLPTLPSDRSGSNVWQGKGSSSSIHQSGPPRSESTSYIMLAGSSMTGATTSTVTTARSTTTAITTPPPGVGSKRRTVRTSKTKLDQRGSKSFFKSDANKVPGNLYQSVQMIGSVNRFDRWNKATRSEGRIAAKIASMPDIAPQQEQQARSGCGKSAAGGKRKMTKCELARLQGSAKPPVYTRTTSHSDLKDAGREKTGSDIKVSQSSATTTKTYTSASQASQNPLALSKRPLSGGPAPPQKLVIEKNLQGRAKSSHHQLVPDSEDFVTFTHHSTNPTSKASDVTLATMIVEESASTGKKLSKRPSSRMSVSGKMVKKQALGVNKGKRAKGASSGKAIPMEILPLVGKNIVKSPLTGKKAFQMPRVMMSSVTDTSAPGQKPLEPTSNQTKPMTHTVKNIIAEIEKNATNIDPSPAVNYQKLADAHAGRTTCVTIPDSGAKICGTGKARAVMPERKPNIQHSGPSSMMDKSSPKTTSSPNAVMTFLNGLLDKTSSALKGGDKSPKVAAGESRSEGRPLLRQSASGEIMMAPAQVEYFPAENVLSSGADTNQMDQSEQSSPTTFSMSLGSMDKPHTILNMDQSQAQMVPQNQSESRGQKSPGSSVAMNTISGPVSPSLWRTPSSSQRTPQTSHHSVQSHLLVTNSSGGTKDSQSNKDMSGMLTLEDTMVPNHPNRISQNPPLAAPLPKYVSITIPSKSSGLSPVDLPMSQQRQPPVESMTSATYERMTNNIATILHEAEMQARRPIVNQQAGSRTSKRPSKLSLAEKALESSGIKRRSRKQSLTNVRSSLGKRRASSTVTPRRSQVKMPAIKGSLTHFRVSQAVAAPNTASASHATPARLRSIKSVPWLNELATTSEARGDKEHSTGKDRRPPWMRTSKKEELQKTGKAGSSKSSERASLGKQKDGPSILDTGHAASELLFKGVNAAKSILPTMVSTATKVGVPQTKKQVVQQNAHQSSSSTSMDSSMTSDDSTATKQTHVLTDIVEEPFIDIDLSPPAQAQKLRKDSFWSRLAPPPPPKSNRREQPRASSEVQQIQARHSRSYEVELPAVRQSSSRRPSIHDDSRASIMAPHVSQRSVQDRSMSVRRRRSSMRKDPSVVAVFPQKRSAAHKKPAGPKAPPKEPSVTEFLESAGIVDFFFPAYTRSKEEEKKPGSKLALRKKSREHSVLASRHHSLPLPNKKLSGQRILPELKTSTRKQRMSSKVSVPTVLVSTKALKRGPTKTRDSLQRRSTQNKLPLQLEIVKRHSGLVKTLKKVPRRKSSVKNEVIHVPLRNLSAASPRERHASKRQNKRRKQSAVKEGSKRTSVPVFMAGHRNNSSLMSTFNNLTKFVGSNASSLLAWRKEPKEKSTLIGAVAVDKRGTNSTRASSRINDDIWSSDDDLIDMAENDRPSEGHESQVKDFEEDLSSSDPILTPRRGTGLKNVDHERGGSVESHSPCMLSVMQGRYLKCCTGFPVLSPSGDSSALTLNCEQCNYHHEGGYNHHESPSMDTAATGADITPIGASFEISSRECLAHKRHGHHGAKTMRYASTDAFSYEPVAESIRRRHSGANGPVQDSSSSSDDADRTLTTSSAAITMTDPCDSHSAVSQHRSMSGGVSDGSLRDVARAEGGLHVVDLRQKRHSTAEDSTSKKSRNSTTESKERRASGKRSELENTRKRHRDRSSSHRSRSVSRRASQTSHKRDHHKSSVKETREADKHRIRTSTHAAAVALLNAAKITRKSLVKETDSSLKSHGRAFAIKGEAFQQSTPLPQDEPDYVVLGKETDSYPVPDVDKKDIDRVRERSKFRRPRRHRRRHHVSATPPTDGADSNATDASITREEEAKQVQQRLLQHRMRHDLFRSRRQMSSNRTSQGPPKVKTEDSSKTSRSIDTKDKETTSQKSEPIAVDTSSQSSRADRLQQQRQVQQQQQQQQQQLQQRTTIQQQQQTPITQQSATIASFNPTAPSAGGSNEVESRPPAKGAVTDGAFTGDTPTLVGDIMSRPKSERRLSANPNQLMGNTTDILETMVAHSVASDEAAAEVIRRRRRSRSKRKPSGPPVALLKKLRPPSLVDPNRRGTYMSLEPAMPVDKVGVGPRKWNKVDLNKIVAHGAPPPSGATVTTIKRGGRRIKAVFRWKDNAKTRRSAQRMSGYTSRFKKVSHLETASASPAGVSSESPALTQQPEVKSASEMQFEDTAAKIAGMSDAGSLQQQVQQQQVEHQESADDPHQHGQQQPVQPQLAPTSTIASQGGRKTPSAASRVSPNEALPLLKAEEDDNKVQLQQVAAAADDKSAQSPSSTQSHMTNSTETAPMEGYTGFEQGATSGPKKDLPERETARSPSKFQAFDDEEHEAGGDDDSEDSDDVAFEIDTGAGGNAWLDVPGQVARSFRDRFGGGNATELRPRRYTEYSSSSDEQPLNLKSNGGRMKGGADQPYSRSAIERAAGGRLPLARRKSQVSAVGKSGRKSGSGSARATPSKTGASSNRHQSVSFRLAEEVGPSGKKKRWHSTEIPKKGILKPVPVKEILYDQSNYKKPVWDSEDFSTSDDETFSDEEMSDEEHAQHGDGVDASTETTRTTMTTCTGTSTSLENTSRSSCTTSEDASSRSDSDVQYPFRVERGVQSMELLPNVGCHAEPYEIVARGRRDVAQQRESHNNLRMSSTTRAAFTELADRLKDKGKDKKRIRIVVRRNITCEAPSRHQPHHQQPPPPPPLLPKQRDWTDMGRGGEFADAAILAREDGPELIEMLRQAYESIKQFKEKKQANIAANIAKGTKSVPSLSSLLKDATELKQPLKQMLPQKRPSSVGPSSSVKPLPPAPFPHGAVKETAQKLLRPARSATQSEPPSYRIRPLPPNVPRKSEMTIAEARSKMAIDRHPKVSQGHCNAKNNQEPESGERKQTSDTVAKVPQMPSFVTNYMNAFTETAKGQFLSNSHIPDLFRRFLSPTHGQCNKPQPSVEIKEEESLSMTHKNLLRNLAGGNPMPPSNLVDSRQQAWRYLPAVDKGQKAPNQCRHSNPILLSDSDIEISCNDAQLSERIVNDFPFGSPGELPTTYGGVLDPNNMPAKHADLLPSLSLAPSGALSPKKEYRRTSSKGLTNAHKCASRQLLDMANSLSDSFLKNVPVKLNVFQCKKDATIESVEPKVLPDDKDISQDKDQGNHPGGGFISRLIYGDKGKVPGPDVMLESLPTGSGSQQDKMVPAPPGGKPLQPRSSGRSRSRSETQHARAPSVSQQRQVQSQWESKEGQSCQASLPPVPSLPVLKSSAVRRREAVSDEASSTRAVTREKTPAVVGIPSKRGHVPQSPPQLPADSLCRSQLTQERQASQSGTATVATPPQTMPPAAAAPTSSARPAVSSKSNQERGTSDSMAMIEQLKAGLAQLAKQNVQLASQVWQDLGSSVLNVQDNSNGKSLNSSTGSPDAQTPVTKEELERELAKVKLLTEQRLAEFFVKAGASIPRL